MARAVPLYLDLARTLREGIAEGRYPVGGLLPTEAELAAAHGVSRQTVRQAIGQLRAQRLLSARKGVGTRVESAAPQAAYYHALQSLPDVFQYARDTVLRITATERVTARGRLAALLGCRPGHAWLHLRGLREPAEAGPPLGVAEVWVDARYAAVAEAPAAHREAIFAKIEARFGVPVAEVQQDLEAVLLDAEAAAVLGTEAGAPALRVTRRYLAPGGEPIEVSITRHPAERFRYSMRLRREA